MEKQEKKEWTSKELPPKQEKEWTSEELQAKQKVGALKRFNVELVDFKDVEGYFYVKNLNVGHKRNYFYIINKPENVEYDKTTKEFIIKHSGQEKRFKIFNVLTLSKKYNNSDLLIAVYTANEYTFLKAKFPEIVQETIDTPEKIKNFSVELGKFLVGKRFAKTFEPFYLKTS